MSHFPLTIDGTTYSCPELALQLGLSESRLRLAVKEFKPTTMGELKEAIRRQLSRPHPKQRPGFGSKRWNGYGLKPERAQQS